MSLTLALAIAGGLVLAAVVAHGAWSARKADPRRAELARGPNAQEPSMTDPNGADTDPMAFSGADAGVDLRLARRPSARLDGLIDAMVSLTLESPVSAELALAHMPATRRAGSKPFLIEGLNAVTGDWEAPTPGASYGEFQAGVQLANRSGALNEIEYSEFVQMVQTFAEGLGAMPDFPDMLEVVASSRELDAFAAGHDAQLALLLVAKEASWSVGYVQQMALRHNFVPGAMPGRLVMPAAEEGAPPMLSLSFDAQAALAALDGDASQASVRELTLSLDVPQTAPSNEPFAAWQQAARALAGDMHAEVTDDRGQPLNLHAFAAIDQELGALYKALESRELAAGSLAARRLFS